MRRILRDGLRALRYAWAAPATLVGLGVATLACACGATLRRVGGTLEVGGGRVGGAVARLPVVMRFDAITLGHVVVGRDHERLAELRAHERVHVAQYERWGPLFVPLYLASSLAARLRGGDPWRGNRFEIEACAKSERDSAA